MIITTNWNLHALEELENKLEQNGPWDSWEMYKLAYRTTKFSQILSFENLHCMDSLIHIDPLPHQLETAKKVISHMHGRAILADEVGLGKTIEAGLILKEYIIRRLVRKALILVPASLILQWVQELRDKFGLPVIGQKKAYSWAAHNFVVASIETAKKEPHRTMILEQEYDMVIIDEAHKLKNPRTLTYRFVNEIKKKYCLLLSATPVQNHLRELIHLVDIIYPGHFKGISNKSDIVALKNKLGEVMIRNRRSEHTTDPIKRVIHNVSLTLSKAETELYEGVCSFIKDCADFEPNSTLSLLTLQREVCSSRDAVFITLVNLFKKTTEESPSRAVIWQLVERIKAIKENTKAEKALELIRSINDKVIIFTEYRATQQYLLHFFKENQIEAIPFQGGMGRGRKDWMTDLFKNRGQVLVATEAGGEGINLQFCNHIINFDLPWNPMRIEQRIGRIHRYGQTKDVHVFNLITKNTIEEHVVSLLMDKIELFKGVIGELEPILMETERSLHQIAVHLLIDSNSEVYSNEA